MYNMIAVTLMVVFSFIVSAQVPQTGVFESCPQCRLDAMPELKRFFHDSVLKSEYGDQLTVKFVPGAVPTLILYGADGKELSREEVSDRLSFDELHSWVQAKGFSKKQQQQAETSTGAASSVQTAAAAAAAPVPPMALHEKRLLRRRRVSATAAAAAAPMPTEGGSSSKRGGRMKQRRKRVKATRLANGTLVGPNGKVLRRRRRRRAKAAAARGNSAPAKAN